MQMKGKEKSQNEIYNKICENKQAKMDILE